MYSMYKKKHLLHELNTNKMFSNTDDHWFQNDEFLNKTFEKSKILSTPIVFIIDEIELVIKLFDKSLFQTVSNFLVTCS